MRDRYRLFRRKSGIFYLFDKKLNRQASLKTSDEFAARRMLVAENEAAYQPQLNLDLAKTYLRGTDEKFATRTWGDALKAIVEDKKGPTRERWERAAKDKAFDAIREKTIRLTMPEHLTEVLRKGTVSTNVYLRKLSNFCISRKWISEPILDTNTWDKEFEVRFKEKRAITWDEHLKVIDREANLERKCFYELLWHMGGAQCDIVMLKAEDIDYAKGLVEFNRRKTKKKSSIRLGPSLRAVLQRLPKKGPLFPHLRTLRSSDLADAFRHRCGTVGVSGVTLHSYRYAFAERCAEAGIPERWSMIMMGHASKAVHRAYEKKALVELPSLDERQA